MMSEFECTNCGAEKDINWANEDGVFMVCKKGSGCMSMPRELNVVGTDHPLVFHATPLKFAYAIAPTDRKARYVHEDREKELLEENKQLSKLLDIETGGLNRLLQKNTTLLEAVKLLRGALEPYAHIEQACKDAGNHIMPMHAQEALEQTKGYEHDQHD